MTLGKGLLYPSARNAGGNIALQRKNAAIGPAYGGLWGACFKFFA